MVAKVKDKDEEMKIPKWVTKYGVFNEMPEPYRECDIGEFYYWYFVYGAKVEFRQIKLPEWKHGRNCKIHWFHEVAFLLASPYKWTHIPDTRILKYEDTPQCYRIGCKHEYKELSVEESELKGYKHMGNCFHVIECKKCGFINAYDSGD